MEKENFISLLQRSSPNEVREFIERKGKLHKICPIVFVEELPSDIKVVSKEGAIDG